METLKNYLLVGCTCISINAKRNEETKNYLGLYLLYIIWGFFMKYL